MVKTEVSWFSGGKEVKVTVECEEDVIDWANECADKVKKTVTAMERVFPRDIEIEK